MWVIKLHLGISVLLILFTAGIYAVLADRIADNLAYLRDGVARKRNLITRFLGRIKMMVMLMCPILNLVIVAVLCLVAAAGRKELDRLKELMGERN